MPTPYRISLAEPDLNGREVYYVNQALMRRQLTQGEFVERFETEFAKYLGVKHAIACSSGTTALHLALLAHGVRYGDKVLVPTLTYVATAAAVRYCGAVPVFGDADPETWGLVPSQVPQSKLTTVIPVHLYGVTCFTTTDEIEDAAEALGATNVARRPAGTIGRMGVFSFYGNKILTTGEGGMVVTDDPFLAEKLRLYRGQGQDPTRRYWHTVVGMNGRMTELSAAIGLGQLERLDQLLAIRWMLHARYYDQGITELLEVQTPRPGTRQAPWVMVGLLPKKALCGSGDYSYPYFRDRVMADLARHGIETRPTFPCVHTMPPYREFAEHVYTHQKDTPPPHVIVDKQAFPIAEDIAARGIVLPLHTRMGTPQVDEICAVLRSLL